MPDLVLAHQGGWDEILLVLTPIALFAGLLWLANSRANKQLRERRAAAEAAAPEGAVDHGEADAPEARPEGRG